MKNTFIYLLAFFPILLFSQEDDSYKLDYNNTRNAAELCTRYKSNGFISNAEADNALGKILSVVGASKRFIVAPCENINNALAITDDGMRYILYDPEFINSISETSNYWANMSILAHEVGHHINGHTLGASMSAYENRIQELEADEFSGFVMQKIGATLEQAIDAIASLAASGDDSYSSHPNKERRTKAITKGFNNAKNNSFVSEKKLTDWEEYYFRGDEKYEAEDYEGAIEDFTESIKLKPDLKTYLYRAYAKSELEDYSGEKSDLWRVIELEPTNWMAHYRLGRNLSLTDDYYGVLSSHSTYFKFNGESDVYYDIWAKFYMSDAFYNLGFYNKSLDYIDNVIEKNDYVSHIDDGFHGQFYELRGNNYLNLEKFELAKKDFEKATELNPEVALYLELMGDTYAKEKNFEKAIEFYNKALKLDPAKYSIYQYKAYAHEALEDYFPALLDMNEAIKHNPDYGLLYFKRGEYSLKMGDQEKACADWLLGNEKGNTDSYNKLLETCGYSKEDFYTAQDFLDAADLEKENGNYTEALRLLFKSKDLGYEDVYYWHTNLYSIYAYSKQYDLALNVLNKIEADTQENNIIWWNDQFVFLNYELKNWVQGTKKIEELMEQFKLNPDALDYSLDIDFINKNIDFVSNLYDYGGLNYKYSGNFNEALNLNNKFLKVGKAIEDDRFIRIAYLRIAENKKDVGQYLEALQDINEYINMREEWSVGYRIRGEIKVAMGKANYACEDFNKALEVSLNNENEGDEVQKEIQKLIDDNCK
jgi:tetratricopeptide (TPR) repeat protein